MGDEGGIAIEAQDFAEMAREMVRKGGVAAKVWRCR
jgi:hypothetical protein